MNTYSNRFCRTEKSSWPALHQTHYPGCRNEGRARNQVRSLLCRYPCNIARVYIELLLRKHQLILSFSHILSPRPTQWTYFGNSQFPLLFASLELHYQWEPSAFNNTHESGSHDMVAGIQNALSLIRQRSTHNNFLHFICLLELSPFDADKTQFQRSMIAVSLP